MKFRFVDLDVVEELGLPLVQIQIGWKVMHEMKYKSKEEQKLWFKNAELERDESEQRDQKYFFKFNTILDKHNPR